jgi:peptidyl-tRNA hydrolase
MNEKRVEEIANAVLYEGYMLYPYRASSVKNRQRWNFGVLYPRNYSELQKGSDLWESETECLVTGNDETRIKVKVRFLHGISRISAAGSGSASGAEMPSQTWQEAAERDVTVGPIAVEKLLTEPVKHSFTLPSNKISEEVGSLNGRAAQTIFRTQEAVTGHVRLTGERLNEGVYRIALVVANDTELDNPAEAARERAVMQSLLSAHSILSLEGGEFVSLLETPEEFCEFRAGCRNVGTWPVLVGEEGQRDAMLSSPIILYDYPQIAPESAGDLFDGTEIDEILALRILTLTEGEKQEMREGDERARQILERTEAMPEEQFMKLHGVLRGMRPSTEEPQ